MTEKTRDSFIFYRSFFEAIIPLNKEQKAEVLEAICSYALDGKLIELQGVSKGFFTLIKPQLDANRRKWENGCKEKKKGSEIKPELEQEISKPEAKDKLIVSKTEGNVNVNVNANVECKSKTSNPLIEDFAKFWNDYTPVKVLDGKVVSKGSRKTAMAAYERARKNHSAEKIYEGAANYLVNCYKNNRLSCQVVVFLNQERFSDDYEQTNLEVKKHG